MIETTIRECFEETNSIITKANFIKELESYSHEFLTPDNKLIRKTIVTFLFNVNEKGDPIAKEERMIAVNWISKDEFLNNCTHENVKNVVRRV